MVNLLHFSIYWQPWPTIHHGRSAPFCTHRDPLSRSEPFENAAARPQASKHAWLETDVRKNTLVKIVIFFLKDVMYHSPKNGQVTLRQVSLDYIQQFIWLFSKRQLFGLFEEQLIFPTMIFLCKIILSSVSS